MTYKRKEKTIRRNSNIKSATDYEPYVSDTVRTERGKVSYDKRLKVYEPVCGESILLGSLKYAELNEDNQKVYTISEEKLAYYTAENWLEEILQKVEEEINSGKELKDTAKNRYLKRLLAQRNNSEAQEDKRMFKKIAAPKSRRKQLLAKATQQAPAQEEIEVVSYEEGLAKRQEHEKAVTSVKENDGALLLLEYTLQATGIEPMLTKIYKRRDTDKIIAFLVYLLLSEKSIRDIDVYQAFHNLRHEGGVSRDTIYNLLTEIGKEENLDKMRSFFMLLFELIGQTPLYAVDSTTTGTYSEKNQLARWGHSKSHENLTVYKTLTIFSIMFNWPVFFEILPGNMSDITQLDNTLKNLNVYGAKDIELLIDNGFISHCNLKIMYERGTKFTGIPKDSEKWIKEIAHQQCGDYATVYEALDDFSNNLNDIDPVTNGVVVSAEITFNSSGKIVSQTAKRIEGEEYTTYPIWVGFYKDYHRYNRDLKAYISSCEELILNLNTGMVDYKDLTYNQKNKLKKLYEVEYDQAGKLQIRKRKEPINKLLENLGTFCIITNSEKDARTLLKMYRLRSRIESAFRKEKQNFFADRGYTGNVDQLKGREFTRMLAMIVSFTFDKLIDRVRKKARAYAETKPTAATRQEYLGIYKWVANRRPAEVLNWFKEVRNVNARSKYAEEALSPACTRRDILFIELFIEVSKETDFASECGEICLFDDEN